MRDVVIPARSIRREILALAICLGLALAINAIAIIVYGTHWIELLTTWRVTLVLALGLYALSAVLRLGWAALGRLFGGARRRQSGVPDTGR